MPAHSLELRVDDKESESENRERKIVHVCVLVSVCFVQ